MSDRGRYLPDFNPERDVDLTNPAERMKYHIPNGLGESEAAHNLAITKINDWLKDQRINGIKFSRPDFDITLEARSVLTGKQHTPVEWTSRKPGMFRGDSGEWMAQISYDDPPSDIRANSVGWPHVGYGIAFLQGGRKRAISKVGHIAVSRGALEACRPRLDPAVQQWFRDRTRPL
jgi:hypothetical protein